MSAEDLRSRLGRMMGRGVGGRRGGRGLGGPRGGGGGRPHPWDRFIGQFFKFILSWCLLICFIFCY